jgi:lipoprotein-releasing system permease protein
LSPYELAVGLRYTRARKGSGRNTFISFISLMSMAGIALGVAALIVVLSVMNGFQQELRNRILAVASHIEIQGMPQLAALLCVGAVDVHVAVAARECVGEETQVGRAQVALSLDDSVPGSVATCVRDRWRSSCRGHSASCWAESPRAASV